MIIRNCFLCGSSPGHTPQVRKDEIERPRAHAREMRADARRWRLRAQIAEAALADREAGERNDRRAS